MSNIFNQIRYPFSTNFIKLNNYEIAFIDQGTSDNILLFIHGLGSYLKAWDRNIPELKKHFRCIALDLPGYGKSSKEIHSGSVSFYVEMLNQFIAKLKLKNVSLVGHSMGGRIASAYAIENPDQIDKLILVASAGFETFNKQEIELLKKIISPDILFKTSDHQIRINYRINFFRMPVEAEEMIADRILIKNDEEFYNYCINVSNSLFGLLYAPVFKRLKEISIPVLILFGKNDQLIPNKSIHQVTTEEIAYLGAAQVRKSKVMLLDECGHFLQYEKPDEFNSQIISFFHEQIH